MNVKVAREQQKLLKMSWWFRKNNSEEQEFYNCLIKTKELIQDLKHQKVINHNTMKIDEAIAIVIALYPKVTTVVCRLSRQKQDHIFHIQLEIDAIVTCSI